MWVEKFRCNMFSNITFHIIWLRLSNTSCIIYIDNGRWPNVLNITWNLDVVFTLRSHAHSRVASYNTMISEWLVDVPIRVVGRCAEAPSRSRVGPRQTKSHAQALLRLRRWPPHPHSSPLPSARAATTVVALTWEPSGIGPCRPSPLVYSITVLHLSRIC
jgi:hypothetical protein